MSPVKAQLMHVQYGEQRISFEWIARPTKSTKLTIKVSPEGCVQVVTPEGTAAPAVLQAVKQRARWIAGQLQQFEQLRQHVLPRQYISGESHWYLGRRYLLKVQSAAKGEASVKLTRGELQVNTPVMTPAAIQAQLHDWYKQRAKVVFNQRLAVLLERALWAGAAPPLRLLTMKTQWGSCSPNGRITLNPHLVKAPRECIDYVILHELCHLLEHNHSKNFYRLLDQVMPQWQQVKQRLDNMAHQLLQV